MNETMNKLYELLKKEVEKIASKGEISPAELENAKCAVELMHKIRHFEDDTEKYGWNEDAGISGRMYRPHYPIESYGDGSYRNGSGRYTYGNGSYNMGRNDYSGAKEHLIREAERMMNAAVNDEERMAIMNYINRLNG